jgi:GTPase SAR1 family protein
MCLRRIWSWLLDLPLSPPSAHCDAAKPTVLKCVSLGVSGVGKSSIFRHATHHDAFALAMDEFGYAIADRALQMWDHGSVERFSTFHRMWLKEARVVLLVFDMVNTDSFAWLCHHASRLVVEHAPPAAVVVLVGNKCDLSHRRRVTCDVARSVASAHNWLYAEICAITGEGVDDLLANAATMARTRSDRTHGEQKGRLAVLETSFRATAIET